MKVTVFTSNQPRHLSLIADLAAMAETVYAVQECNTVFPGEVEDFFRRTDVMQRYFRHVLDAERAVFGEVGFPPDNVLQLPIKMGDASMLPLGSLSEALTADVFVVFGASYLRGSLCDALVERRAVNIHMGVSPFYRGSSTNFWALYDGRPDLVGATIHVLTAGLDSGPILFHAFPPADTHEPFVLGMKSVRAAHLALADAIRSGEWSTVAPVPQDRSLELRYTRNRDFTDDIAGEYLQRLPSPQDIEASMTARAEAGLVRPRIC